MESAELEKNDFTYIAPGLILMIGPPASGKSSFIRNFLSQNRLDPEVSISSDEIGEKLFGADYGRGHDTEIFKCRNECLEAQLRNQGVAIADSTNLWSESRRRLIDMSHNLNLPVTALLFNAPLDVLLLQNQGRPKDVDDLIGPYYELMGRIDEDILIDEGIDYVFEAPGQSNGYNAYQSASNFHLIPRRKNVRYGAKTY
jgi:predicted kinase